MCANSLYCGGPKTLLTDQHLLRTNLFFVTETSELRLAGLDVEAPPAILGNTLYSKWSFAREKIPSDPVVGRV